MESFIVRIYRREGKRSRHLLGTVETIGLTGKCAFTNSDELWEILNMKNDCVRTVDAGDGGAFRSTKRPRCRKR